MISSIALILFYIFAPLLINFLCYKYSFVQKMGAVVVAYLIGLILGNIGIMPEASQTMIELTTNKNIILTNQYVQELFIAGTISADDVRYFHTYQIQDLITTLAIAFALPLLLFSLNVRQWFKTAGNTFLSLFLGLVSVIIPIVLGYFLFKDQIADSWKVAGMMTGVYSGGTPNLASIQKALDVDTLTYVLTHTYDLIIGAVFLFFVMTVAQRLLLKVLPAYKNSESYLQEAEFDFDKEAKKPFFDPLRKVYLIPNLAAFGVAVVIVGISAGLGELFRKDLQMMIIILSITSLSILVSLIPRINRIKKTFDYGMYFILIFSLVVASMADLRYFSMSHIHIFYWVVIVYIGSFIIHVALAALFKVDADNVIIVSTALTCSPPFVPVVAGAIRNKEIIISGLTVGIVGYALGNYLGILLAHTLAYF